MSSDCAFSRGNPFQSYQAEISPSEAEGLGASLYSVSLEVTNGTFSDTLTITFKNALGKVAGTFAGALIPSNLTAGTYAGSAAFAGTIASYVGQQIIALATQVNGTNTINFATQTAVIGSVISGKLDVSCSAGLFHADGPPTN